MVNRTGTVLTAAFFVILSLLSYADVASGDILEWIGPNGTATPWETPADWYPLGYGSNREPNDLDTARLYNALGLGFTDSDVTVSSTIAICQKLQMKYLTTKLTVLTGGKLTTTGSVEMYQGDSSQLDIQAGATMDACTKSNIDTASFRLSSGSAAAGPDTVNVYGTLNIVSQTPVNGTSLLEITNNSSASGTNTGTLNIYSTGVLNVDAYVIGSYGTGRIYISEGGVMTITGDATEQVNGDIVAGKIAGVGVAVTASYNSGENKTYVTAGGTIPAPPEAPASIGYPPSNFTGSYTVSWTSSSGAILYQVERSNDSGANWSQIYSGGNLSYPETITDGGYRYRVRAANSGGFSGWTTGTFDCVVVVNTPPLPPASIIYPSTSNNGQYTVSWASSSGASSYQLERSSNGGGSWGQIYSGGSISYSEDVNNGSYRYRVKATNAAGTSDWATGSFDCVVVIPQVSVSFVAGTAVGWDFHELAGDIARNNTVDLNDLSIFAQHWLDSSCGDPNQWCSGADINAGGDVDFVDYAFLANNWDKEAGENVLLQTIYGTAQDSSGNITANLSRAVQGEKGLAMVFNVPEDTMLDKGIFKCSANPWRLPRDLRIRLFNVTGQNYLSFSGHPTITRANPGGVGNPPIFDYTLNTPDPTPYHSELSDGRQYADIIIDFGALPVTAGEYFITFDHPQTVNTTWGSMIRSGPGGEYANMGRYPDGTSLPKAATVTTSSTTGNTYYYQLDTYFDANYTPFSYLFAFQITTTSGQ